jgi:drug/metabolite transporter (DMT)-like permease
MNQTVLYSCIILFGTFISAVSQVMLKKSAMKDHGSLMKEYANPLVIGAYVLFVLATLCSVIAYRGIPLSLGAVLEATSYIYVTWFGVTLFHETISRRKAAALALIIIGIVIYSVFGGS